MEVLISDLFNIINAKSRSIDDYSEGDVAFITNGFYNNGIIGKVTPFDDDKVFNQPSICVSAFCEATVHKGPFVARGNGGSGLTILTPKEKMSYKKLLNYAAIINSTLQWRYSYGRMVTISRFEKETITKIEEFDETKIQDIDELIPALDNSGSNYSIDSNFKDFNFTDLFELNHGDFHSLNDLDEGNYPTVSRIDSNNGIEGYYEKPDSAEIYSPLTITVSTVSGKSFVQLHRFLCTDNVVICDPKIDFKPTTLFFISMMLNREKWRWMYGRQCYKTKFAKTIIKLPIDSKGKVDETSIKKFIESQPYWSVVKDYLNKVEDTRELFRDELVATA